MSETIGNICKFNLILILIYLLFVPMSVRGSEEKEEGSLRLNEVTQQFFNQLDEKKAYTYTLAEEKIDRPDEYNRKEIESFLCSCVLGYIRVEDLQLIPEGRKFIVRAREMDANLKKMAERGEISKWYENRVTVSIKGNVDPIDKKVVQKFFSRINQIIGSNKFIFKENVGVTNIIIEFSSQKDSEKNHSYMAETMVLVDDLRIRLVTDDHNKSLNIQTYKLGSGKIIVDANNIELNDPEKEFRKKNRLVKVYIKKISNPTTRYFTIIHELLHSIGFAGHSPYYESHLFPLPVRTFSYLLPVYNGKNPILTSMAEQMVEMLYRPEILPGMTVKEAGKILTHLKKRKFTEESEMFIYLLKRKVQLEKLKRSTIEEEKANYLKKIKLYVLLDKLVNKEFQYLEELREIREDYGLETTLVKNIRKAGSMMAKLVLIRQFLILNENKKKQLVQSLNVQNPRKEVRRIKKDLRRVNEEIIVLNDLLRAEREIGAMEQFIVSGISGSAQEKVETNLRKMIRQILTIDQELKTLGNPIADLMPLIY